MTNKRRLPNLEIENATLYFRNFSGKPSEYNETDGENRSFGVVIEDPDQAQEMKNDGWNIKISKYTDDEGKPTYYLPVAVDYKRADRFPVHIFLYTRKNKKSLSEEEIGTLDSAEFANVDLLIRPYAWENRRGETGVKAYLTEMHAVLEENRFTEKYAAYEYPEDEAPF